jgi:phage-related protein
MSSLNNIDEALKSLEELTKKVENDFQKSLQELPENQRTYMVDSMNKAKNGTLDIQEFLNNIVNGG